MPTDLRPPRADAQRNRELLLAAALKLFTTSKDEVTLSAVAEAAGVGIGTLYRHFPTRDALVAAVYRSETEQLTSAAKTLSAAHAPLEALIRFGKGGEKLVPVKLGARLTETGTLETWCDSKISDNRWRLQFQLRKTPVGSVTSNRPAAVVSGEAVDAALELVRGTFADGPVAPGNGRGEPALLVAR